MVLLDIKDHPLMFLILIGGLAMLIVGIVLGIKSEDSFISQQCQKNQQQQHQRGRGQPMLFSQENKFSILRSRGLQ